MGVLLVNLLPEIADVPASLGGIIHILKVQRDVHGYIQPIEEQHGNVT